MKAKLILLTTFCIFLVGCNVKINPTHGFIEIRQNNLTIEHESGIYDFGSISVNEISSDVLFKIYNVGKTQLDLTGTPIINISGTDSVMFTVNQSMTYSTVFSGSITMFTIKFNPTSAGLKMATISVENTDSSKNPYTFTITGKGITPEINLKQNSTDILNNIGVYDFGEIELNHSSSIITFTIENIGTANLNLTGSRKIQITGSDASMFTVYQTMTISQITPNHSTTFTVSFKPTSGGIKSATISIFNNDLDENPYTFKVIGICRPYYCWTKRLGGSNLDYGVSLVTDLTGNIYVAGSFSDTVDFGADFGVIDSKTSNGYHDIFITKIIANGTYGWTKTIGGISNDYAFSIVTDTSGNVYITGDFFGYVNFGEDFGVSDPQTSKGLADVFIMKINSNGSYGWTKSFGGIASDTGYSITIDSSGNTYITGEFYETINFGADFGVSDIKTSAGDIDVFVTKINLNGSYGWTRIIGGIKSDTGHSIVTDTANNIYVTGYFRSTVDFGTDFGVSDSKSIIGNNQDIFVTKINANGTYGWTRTLASSSSIRRNSITADSSGNVYIMGLFINTVDFGIDFGVSDVKTSSKYDGEYYYDIFVTKINVNGTYDWTKRFCGMKANIGSSIRTDTSDNVYITGYFWNSVNFGADFGVTDIKTSAGYVDVFISKINSNGTYGWTKRLGGSMSDYSYSVTEDSFGGIYILGVFEGTTDFGRDFGVSEIKTSEGRYDIFITKICP